MTILSLLSVPSLPPGALQCTALSSQSVRVAWEPPPLRGRNGVLQGYRVTYAPVTDWFGKYLIVLYIHILPVDNSALKAYEIQV